MTLNPTSNGRKKKLIWNRRANSKISKPFSSLEPQVGQLIPAGFELNAGGTGDHVKCLLDVRLSIGCENMDIKYNEIDFFNFYIGVSWTITAKYSVKRKLIYNE